MRYLLPLVLLSCSSTPPTCAETCDGCCIEEACRPGGLANACGSHGSDCVDCTKSGDVCSTNAGVTSCHPGSGGGAATGGGSAVGGGAGGGGVVDPLISVEVHYQYEPSPACGTCDGGLPALLDCSYTGHLPQSRWLDGGVSTRMGMRCTVTGGGTSYVAQCDSACTQASPASCTDGSPKLCWESCSPPYGSTSTACIWTP